MIFEPKPDQIIEQLLIKHFSIQVYRCLCESVAAEHGARMSAMENATNNAKEVVSRLTLTYNKLRQEKITTELIEIVSGAEALK
jgi:F-type H+-transporting ATPase subunit gamma